MTSRTAPLLSFLAFAGLLAGCQREEKIEHYRPLKPEALLRTYFGESAPAHTAAAAPAEADVPKTHRMLAAIVPHSPQFWFFKLVGPIEAVDAQGEAFLSLIRSVQFDATSGKPKWTLPKGWQELPGSGTGLAARFATLKIGEGDKSLEVPVTSLELQGMEALLENINRWRGQMSLGPVETKEQLAEILDPIKTTDGTPAFIVHLAGKFQPGGMSGAPFANGGRSDLPAGHPAIEPKAGPVDPSSSAADSPTAPLKFDTPAGWQVGKPDAMRAAVLTVKDGSRAAEITVIPLPPFAGDIAKNVNRWREQLKLPAADEKEIAAAVKLIEAGGVKGSYVEIYAAKEASPREGILAVIAPTPDKVWFIKLKGDAELAEREKPRFEAFVKSIQLNPAK